MAARERTKYPGVYRRVSKKRSLNGKPDICFDITYKLEGRKIWEKAGWLSEGYSEKLASDIRAERIRSIRHGLELPQQRAKVPFLKDVWVKYQAWALTNKKSARDDISRYDNHIRDRFGEKRMNEINAFDLERMKSELIKEGLAPATTKHCLVIIRQVYNKAFAWNLYKGGNPIKGVKMPRVDNKRTRFLSHEEAHTLLEELKKRSLQVHDQAAVSLYVGLRFGEIASLRCGDIDFDHGIIQVRDSKAGSRQAYMTNSIKALFQARRPERARPGDLVFKSRKGVKQGHVSSAFRRAVASLGLNEGKIDTRDKVVFHTLRHTFASWLALQGESLITIRDLLGHQTTAMTERYSHLIPDHKKKAVGRLEAAFNNDQKNNIFSIEK